MKASTWLPIIVARTRNVMSGQKSDYKLIVNHSYIILAKTRIDM
jgi:hypothetical protein